MKSPAPKLRFPISPRETMLGFFGPEKLSLDYIGSERGSSSLSQASSEWDNEVDHGE